MVLKRNLKEIKDSEMIKGVDLEVTEFRNLVNRSDLSEIG
jgi:hypothetical protein